MAPTPVKTTPASATKKRRRPSHSSTPRASTSQTTLDSLAPAQSATAKKAKKVKRTEEEQAQEQNEGEDKRFSAFLDEDDVEQGSLDAGEDEEELRELRELDVDLDEAGEAIGEADDRFASFPTEDDDVELSERELLERTTLPAHLLPRSAVATKAGKQAKTPGLIYLSRIPPGMGPGKVKHLLSQFGEVGRIYLARADAGKEISAAKRYKQKERHQSHNFKEGWVEYMDKRVARSVAEMLNANPIGKALTMGGTRWGKKSDKWHDDIWTMRYLPRFRWDQLSEQVALERATQTSLLRFHLTHSKSEQESYLSAVERAKTNKQIEDKAVSRGKAPKGAKAPAAAGAAKEGAAGGEKKEKKGREYRQREVVDVSKKMGKERDGVKLESVLGRLF